MRPHQSHKRTYSMPMLGMPDRMQCLDCGGWGLLLARPCPYVQPQGVYLRLACHLADDPCPLGAEEKL